ncbi:MAG: hypothetical protein WCC64_02995 [Aliidongia sp.]
MPVGRPPIYDTALAAVVLTRIADGESLRAICASEGMPGRTAVYGWIFDDIEGFAGRYARAREMQAHALVDDISTISDDGSNDWMAKNDPDNPGYALNGEHVQRSRLRVDARKWAASKILPKVYGEKIQQEHTGADGTPLMPSLTVTIAKE